MVKAWLVIILCFLGGAIGFLGWFISFEPYYAFTYASKEAVAVAATRSQKPADPTEYLGETRYQFPLRFKTEAGEIITSSTYYTSTFVPRRVIDEIQNQGHAKVIYQVADPTRVLFEGDVSKLPISWGWLAWGVFSSLAGVFLIGHRYRLAGYTQFLGQADAPE